MSFFVLAFGAYAVTAILDGVAGWGIGGGWLDGSFSRWVPLAFWVTLAALTLWLAAVYRCRLVRVWAGGIVALVIVDGIWSGGAMRTPDGLYEAAQATCMTALALSLARRHGLCARGFGFGRRYAGADDPAGRRQALTVFLWALGGAITATMASNLIVAAGLPHGHSPIGVKEDLLAVFVRILSAGVAEEVLAAVVVMSLSAARRPAWEIYAVPMLMRVSYHMYYQAVGPAVLIMGLVNVWLYRRTRRLTRIRE